MPDATLIIPPPEIRKIIDKLASYVATHGRAFEQKVLERQGNDPKFAFIRPNDHYHAYYLQQVNLLKSGSTDGEETQETVTMETENETETETEIKEEKLQSEIVKSIDKREEERKSFLDKLRSGAAIKTSIAVKEDQTPEEPASFKYYLTIPLSQISALDLEIIKLTAQFVAKNGENFLSGIRDNRDPQYDFLKNGHPANPLFNTLVESYSSIIRPPRDIIEQLSEGKSKKKMLESILKRTEWERYQQKNLKDQEDAEREEREARSLIDWHSFIIVETIDFQEGEELAEPQDFSKIQTSEPVKSDSDIEMDEDDMDMEIEDTAEAQTVTVSNLKIRKDYKPSLPKAVQPKITYQKCPICSHEIPTDELDEHVKIELLDPRFAEQRAALNKKTKTSSLASGSHIVQYLQGLKPHRTDIFGDSESLQIGNVEKAQKPDKNIWDGHSGSARHASTAALSGMTIQEQINAIHEAKGITKSKETDSVRSPTQTQVPTDLSPQQNQQQITPTQTMPMPPFMQDPAMYGMMQPPGYPMVLPIAPGIVPPVMPPVPIPVPVPSSVISPTNSFEEPPPAKKAKVEEWTDHLVSEEEWLSSHPGPVTLRIITPNHPNRNNWKLDGSAVEISINLNETIQKLKEELAKKLNMPANKQNLRVDIHFLKDKDSLAHYNLDSQVEIMLGVKERSKRRK